MRGDNSPQLSPLSKERNEKMKSSEKNTKCKNCAATGKGALKKPESIEMYIRLLEWMAWGLNSRQCINEAIDQHLNINLARAMLSRINRQRFYHVKKQLAFISSKYTVDELKQHTCQREQYQRERREVREMWRGAGNANK